MGCTHARFLEGDFGGVRGRTSALGRFAPKQCLGRETDLNEAALRRTLARDTIWQGNCDLSGQQLRSNIASVRNTIPIQNPYKQLPFQKRLPSSRCIERAPGEVSAIPQPGLAGAHPIQP